MKIEDNVNTKQWKDDFSVLMESPLAKKYRNWMLRRSGFLKFVSNKNSRIIDIGCGQGPSLDFFWSNGYKNLVGIEPDPDLTKKIPSQIKAEIHHCGAENLSLPNETVDVVFVYAVLHHLKGLEAYEQACREIHRVLKPGGLAFIIEPGRYHLILLLEQMFNILGLVSKTFKACANLMDKERPEHHFFTKNHGVVRKTFLDLGFEKLVDDYCAYTWVFTIKKNGK